MKTAAVVYVLVVITGTGNVSNSRYKSLHMCEEAKSLALTGQTIEAHAREEKETIERNIKKEEEFAKNHPPREPSSEEEKSVIKNAKAEKNTSGTVGHGNWTCEHGTGNDECSGYYITENYKIQDKPEMVGNFEIDSDDNKQGSGGVKTAECILGG